MRRYRRAGYNFRVVEVTTDKLLGGSHYGIVAAG